MCVVCVQVEGACVGACVLMCSLRTLESIGQAAGYITHWNVTRDAHYSLPVLTGVLLCHSRCFQNRLWVRFASR